MAVDDDRNDEVADGTDEMCSASVQAPVSGYASGLTKHTGPLMAKTSWKEKNAINGDKDICRV